MTHFANERVKREDLRIGRLGALIVNMFKSKDTEALRAVDIFPEHKEVEEVSEELARERERALLGYLNARGKKRDGRT